jgi:hypothetical protein
VQIGKKRYRCCVDGKEFSTVNIMRAHFEKSHKKDAIAWFEKIQGGEVIFTQRYTPHNMPSSMILT